MRIRCLNAGQSGHLHAVKTSVGKKMRVSALKLRFAAEAEKSVLHGTACTCCAYVRASAAALALDCVFRSLIKCCRSGHVHLLTSCEHLKNKLRLFNVSVSALFSDHRILECAEKHCGASALYFNTPTTHRSAVYFTINIYYFKSVSELEARSHLSAVHHLTAVNTVKIPLFVPFDPIFCFLTQIRPYLIVVGVERSL